MREVSLVATLGVAVDARGSSPVAGALLLGSEGRADELLGWPVLLLLDEGLHHQVAAVQPQGRRGLMTASRSRQPPPPTHERERPER